MKVNAIGAAAGASAIGCVGSLLVASNPVLLAFAMTAVAVFQSYRTDMLNDRRVETRAQAKNRETAEVAAARQAQLEGGSASEPQPVVPTKSTSGKQRLDFPPGLFSEALACERSAAITTRNLVVVSLTWAAASCLASLVLNFSAGTLLGSVLALPAFLISCVQPVAFIGIACALAAALGACITHLSGTFKACRDVLSVCLSPIAGFLWILDAASQKTQKRMIDPTLVRLSPMWTKLTERFPKLAIQFSGASAPVVSAR